MNSSSSKTTRRLARSTLRTLSSKCGKRKGPLSLYFSLLRGADFFSRRYNEIFFMIDTCQATTMYSKFYSPNILATGSSQLAENSYSVRTLKVGGFQTKLI